MADRSWHEKLPSEDLEVSEEHIYRFFETMHERQAIWYRRFVQNKRRPWTNDEIFAKYKFTNVYRELDKNSQWLIHNVIRDKSLDLEEKIWKMLFFRLFNNPETFQKHPKYKNGIPSRYEYDPYLWNRYLDQLRGKGIIPFTTSYYINSTGAHSKDRNAGFSHNVLVQLLDLLPEIFKVLKTAEKPQEIISTFKKIPCVADFIAHEFYQDLTYLPKYTDETAMKFDQNDFTNVGPGASVGIRLILPSLGWKAKNQIQGIYELRDLAPDMLDDISYKTGIPFYYVHWNKNLEDYQCLTKKPNITLHHIEMWLCEYCKYWKMSIGEGRQRQTFIPTTDKFYEKQ